LETPIDPHRFAARMEENADKTSAAQESPVAETRLGNIIDQITFQWPVRNNLLLYPLMNLLSPRRAAARQNGILKG